MTTVASRKQKGRNGQKLVRDTILIYYPNLTDQDVRSCSSGSNGEDILLSPLARGFFPYSIEVKARKTISIYGWYDQAKNNSNSHEPLLVIKQDRRRPLAVVDLEHFMTLQRKALVHDEQ